MKPGSQRSTQGPQLLKPHFSFPIFYMSTEQKAPETVDDKPQAVKADLRKFNNTEAKVNKTLAELETITVITDQAGVEEAMVIMKDAKVVENAVEAKRKELVKPFNDAAARINAFAKDLTGKIPPAIQRGKFAIMAFQKAEETRLKNLRTTARKEQLKTLGFIEGSNFLQRGEGLDKMIVSNSEIENFEDSIWSGKISSITNDIEAEKEKQIADLQADKDAAAFFGESEETAAIQQQISEVKGTIISAATPSYIPSFGSPKVKGLTKRWTFEITDTAQVPREFLQVDEKKIREAIAAGERSIAGVRIYQDESISLR